MTMHGAIQIRQYMEEDEASCRACIIERQEAERRIDSRLRPGVDIAAAHLQEMHAHCRDYSGTMLLAHTGSEVVGLVVVLVRVPFEHLDEPPGTYAIVAELVVRHAYRRRGVGAALLRAAERHATNAGASELRIGVLSGNHSARNLYLRSGFAPYLETLSKPLTGARSVPNSPP